MPDNMILKAAMELAFYRVMKCSPKEVFSKIGIDKKMLDPSYYSEVISKVTECKRLGIKDDVFDVADIENLLVMIEKLSAHALSSFDESGDFPGDSMVQVMFVSPKSRGPGGPDEGEFFDEEEEEDYF